jgi:hypothetical protein
VLSSVDGATSGALPPNHGRPCLVVLVPEADRATAAALVDSHVRGELLPTVFTHAVYLCAMHRCATYRCVVH